MVGVKLSANSYSLIQISEKGNDGDTEAYSSPVDGAREKWSSALLKTTLWSHAVHDYSG